MEDGCSKRFDLGTMDLRAEGNSGIGSGKRQYQGKSSTASASESTVPRRTHTTVSASMTGLPVVPSLVVGGNGVSEPNGPWAAAR
jgi:hypothetical protein